MWYLHIARDPRENVCMKQFLHCMDKLVLEEYRKQRVGRNQRAGTLEGLTGTRGFAAKVHARWEDTVCTTIRTLQYEDKQLIYKKVHPKNMKHAQTIIN